ncbi:IQ domain-containing protein K-like [Plodia interpunctella]|uniref:IQ domain-containing protein K-like n=1 Tax=Plodia interpunctella TaxID=58824 RepID=UPI0023681996|nr:IQ domain-containing protein K-like [Plodia interpunctella]
MAGKSSDRKKGKDAKSTTNEVADTLATFQLPDSLSCSEVEFPVLMTRSNKASWRQIVEEHEQRMQELKEYSESKKEPIVKAPFLKTECDYIKNEVFVHLLPALTETLNKAKIWEALIRQKCFFNGIDHISQVLWNNNPRYQERKHNNWHLFNMPWVRDYLKKHPRPYYPKSWLWPEEYAATVIQKTVRQYFVQRDEEVQEMRDFWRKLELERDLCPEMEFNPFLAKKFASSTHFRNKL